MLHVIHLFLEVSLFLSIIPKQLFHLDTSNANRLLSCDETWANHFTRHLKQLGMHFGRSSDIWETSPIPLLMRKWKLLFVNGCEYNSHISTATKLLNPCQHETNTSVCTGSWNMTIVHWKKWVTHTCNAEVTAHVISGTLGDLTHATSFARKHIYIRFLTMGTFFWRLLSFNLGCKGSSRYTWTKCMQLNQNWSDSR